MARPLIFFVFVGILMACIATIYNFAMLYNISNDASEMRDIDMPSVVHKNRNTNDKGNAPSKKDEESDSSSQFSQHKISGLNCDAYGGPSSNKAKEMIYWSDIKTDALYSSPYKTANKVTKYLTFEPDQAGWNNMRMGFETIIAMAHAMGRTLVLPPPRGIYLMGNRQNKQKSAFTFDDFYHLESISVEHPGLDVISMEEFLSREAMNGRLTSHVPNVKEASSNSAQSPQVLFPPGNITKWSSNLGKLYSYLRDVGHIEKWDPNVCVAAFPTTTDPSHLKNLSDILDGILTERGGRKRPFPRDYAGKPVPVDAPPEERLREMLARRQQLCFYDEKMQEDVVLHFKEDYKSGFRLLTHFYGFLFFEDWKQSTWNSRFIRDHVRYSDEIMCAAGRIVDAVRDRARARNPQSNPDGLFDTLHVRRGDFSSQYKDQVVDIEEILKSIEDEIKPNSTIYIATDEKNMTYFQPLAEVYDIHFLKDFAHLIPGVNTNYFGPIDQMVAARGRVFFGVFLSTFTGYINRLRGYYSVKEKQPGHMQGIISSYHYVGDKYNMRRYEAFKVPSFLREYPVAWRDIDKGIEGLQM